MLKIEKVLNYMNFFCASIPLLIVIYYIITQCDLTYFFYGFGIILYSVILYNSLKENIKEFHNLSQEEKDKIIFEWTLETS
jgi:hypothetical protein